MSDDTDKLLEDDAPDADDELDEDVDEEVEDTDEAEDDEDIDEDGEEDEADEEDEDEEDDGELTSTPPARSGSSGSGLFWGGVIIIIVAVIAIWGWSALKDAKDEKAAQDKLLVQEAGAQVGRIQVGITDALTAFQAADEPDAAVLINALETATDSLRLQASATMNIGTDDAQTLGQRIADLQIALNGAIGDIEQDQAVYDEAVRALQVARETLKASAEDRLEPITANLAIVASTGIGDSETPVVIPRTESDTDVDDADLEEADVEDGDADEEDADEDETDAADEDEDEDATSDADETDEEAVE